MPKDGQTHTARLHRLIDTIKRTKLELREAELQRDELKSQLANVDELFEIDPSNSTSQIDAPPDPLDLRIAALERALDGLLTQYTDRHPDIVATRRVIADLEAQKAAEAAAAAAEAAGEVEDPPGVSREQLRNPMYQQLKVVLGQQEALVAGLTARVAQFVENAHELRTLVDTSLNVETELKRLDRDYAINRGNFTKLVSRRESLNIADDVSQSTDEVQFNILEPPRVPLRPFGPNRVRLSGGVLVGGLGVGIGLALLFGLLRPAVYSREALQEFTQLPVIGVVSRIWTPRELLRRRMEVASFAVGCMCLVALFAGLMVLQKNDVNFAAKIQRVAERLL